MYTLRYNQQAMTWANTNEDPRGHMASLGRVSINEMVIWLNQWRAAYMMLYVPDNNKLNLTARHGRSFSIFIDEITSMLLSPGLSPFWSGERCVNILV